MTVDDDQLPVLRSLDALAGLVEQKDNLYVRWSRGPRRDLGEASSTDELTGISLPGLSVNALDVEPWWQGRPVRLWVARRLYDYCHLREHKGPEVRPWVLRARAIGRGPDNEPLVRDVTPIAWIDGRVIAEAEDEIALQRGPWGPLDRSAGSGGGGGTRAR
ncbi:DUF6098 family protein [Streptomyces sp. ISL-11]|uniref:DUF6098 family protein n=1 Tax=Streptomyces sp. ISL-11 TaxID=2819174 RepID=UPI001BEBBD39|nr:DUF6098 family protein [Streptomyces sp. ISL-11]MBT2382188.1 hypothetical protein [Streptomyces sp. ISL-11]